MPHSEAEKTEEKKCVYEITSIKIDGGLICKTGNFDFDNGLNSSVNFAILDASHREYESSFRMAVANFGANLNLSPTDGVDVGVDVDLLRAIYEQDNFKVGVGLNYSTGVKWSPDSMKLHFFGYGFEYDADGFGLRIPIFDLKYKWW